MWNSFARPIRWVAGRLNEVKHAMASSTLVEDVPFDNPPDNFNDSKFARDAFDELKDIIGRQ